MAPVITALGKRRSLRQELILTGQHPGLETRFGLAPSAIRKLRLDLNEQTAGEIREALRAALCGTLIRSRPDLVLVQGDTSSALAGALAANDCGIPIGHVEAGLRSGDLQQPWPEEGNRIRIDNLSTLLFAPTETAVDRLMNEEVPGAVHLTGNSGIDALLDVRRAGSDANARDRSKLLLVTCHRRENWGELEKVATALTRLARETAIEIVFVLHSNPELRRKVWRCFAGEPRVTLLKAVEYEEMVLLMDRAWLILTDSGGLQEEAPALGRPVLVLRNVTERVEAVESGNVALVGTDPDRIVAAVVDLLENADRYRAMSRPSFPFGDGHAAPRIAAAVEEFLTSRAARRARRYDVSAAAAVTFDLARQL